MSMLCPPPQEAQVTLDCVIPHKKHRSILGPKGSNVQAVTQEYNVTIKFPDKQQQQQQQQDGDKVNKQ